jgi:hypothetical protein
MNLFMAFLNGPKNLIPLAFNVRSVSVQMSLKASGFEDCVTSHDILRNRNADTYWNQTKIYNNFHKPRSSLVVILSSSKIWQRAAVLLFVVTKLMVVQAQNSRRLSLVSRGLLKASFYQSVLKMRDLLLEFTNDEGLLPR